MKGRDASFCQKTTKNQIVIGHNEIDVYAGSKSFDIMKPEYQWKAERAYIMKGSSDNEFDKEDIGIVQIPDVRPFFNREKLNEEDLLAQANIIPVCLAALNYDITKETMIGIGWGSQYDEKPGDISGIRHSRFSSCMTSEAGPQKWRFRNCDMKEIKKNRWECEKYEFPPSYELGDYEKCNQYFREAELRKDVIKATGEKEIKYIDIIYDIDVKEDRQLTCYKPAHLQERGWCKLAKQEDVKEVSWGICSSSCKTKYLRVSNS